jgi:hypothetical protein
VFAATAVAALTLLAGRAGVSVLQTTRPSADARAAFSVSHPRDAHITIGRPAGLPDVGAPGRLGTTAAVTVLLILCTVSVLRSRAPFAAPRSHRWVRGPPVPAAHPRTAAR